MEQQKITITASQLKDTALAQRADLKGQEVALSIAGKEIELARVERISDVTLSLEYSQDLSDRDRLAGLKLSVPLPFFDRKQGEIAKARAKQIKTDLELKLLHAVIEKEVMNGLTRLQAAQQTFQLFGGGILPLAEGHLKLSQAAYEQGQAGIPTLWMPSGDFQRRDWASTV